MADTCEKYSNASPVGGRMNTNFKIKRWQSKKYRAAAKDQPCTMRLPCCNGNRETTVLAHANGGGMGMKSDDHDAADMCSSCHDFYDGRGVISNCSLTNNLLAQADLQKEFERARYETLINRITRGILK